jgi:hypothetical protein
MTKLLEEAVAKVQGLSDEEQDYVAAMLLDFTSREADSYQLTPEQVAEVELARKEAKEGLFASDEEMRELWRRFGLEISDGLAEHVFNYLKSKNLLAHAV